MKVCIDKEKNKRKRKKKLKKEAKKMILYDKKNYDECIKKQANEKKEMTKKKSIKNSKLDLTIIHAV